MKIRSCPTPADAKKIRGGSRRILCLLFLLAAVVATCCAVLPPAVSALPTPGETTTGNRPLWLRRENGPANGVDLAQAVAVSPNGTTVFVTGVTNDLEKYATIAYNAATGQRLWLSEYNGSTLYDEAAALAVSPDGTKLFVTGSSGSASTFDYATIGYDAATGEELWVTRYDGPTHDPDEAYALAVSPDGTQVFVTGQSYGVLGEGRDYATVAYDAATGQELWVTRYDGPAHGEKESNDAAYALAVSPDGTKVIVTGDSGGINSFSDYATVAYNAATGEQLWLHRYNGPTNGADVAQAVLASPDGTTVFVTGFSDGGAGTYFDYATLACDLSTGQQLWLSRYDGPNHGFDSAYAMALSPDGTKVFVTGSSDGADLGIGDYGTQAYDAVNGEELWFRRYNGPGNSTDSASAIATSPDGTTVFVTGLSSGVNSDFPFDYATVAYDAATGRVRWHNRFNGPANLTDTPFDLVVSPDGSRLFVTGSSDGIDSGTDYATLAYRASVAEP